MIEPIDARRARLVLAAALVVAAAGLWVFVLRGPDQPADPELGPADRSVPDVEPPGDPARVPLPGFGEVAVVVEPAGGGDLLAWCLLAALDAEARARGLMGVTDLGGYAGMAFRYREPTTSSFWMRNTPMPLSIAWIDGDGSVVSVADMEPCGDRDDCQRYPPAGPYRTAIEVPQGRLPALGITEGARVHVGGACAPRAG